ncbi:MAG: alpha/beta hydrolase fold domain-containing protein [Acidobacteria bacterium]|nr:alpha/beta hydrolase fold domain-containing protein [Acidobacteriota bacterium]
MRRHVRWRLHIAELGGSHQEEERRMRSKTNDISRLASSLVAAVVIVLPLLSCRDQTSQPKVQSAPMVSVDKDGTVHLPAFEVPLSSYMSEQAKQAYIDQALQPPLVMDPRVPISKAREVVDNYYRPLVERGKGLYPVNIEEQKFAGVRTDVVTPKEGVSARNRDRVLINLHGGGFSVGAGLGGLAESIPIASVGKFKVITVDYRMAPEYEFPAASEDVAAVYKELLKQYKPGNIGIYGCSAGGVLTAEAVAWFQKEKLPRPGAIGIFCAGASGSPGGDARYISAPLSAIVMSGLVSPPPAKPNPPPIPLGYFSNANLTDPLVSPVGSPAVLAKFPPTLVVTGTRDLALSWAAHTHTQLVKAEVEADLHVWEGMWHNFLFEMNLPESKEAYDVIVKFFDKHLGNK